MITMSVVFKVKNSRFYECRLSFAILRENIFYDFL